MSLVVAGSLDALGQSTPAQFLAIAQQAEQRKDPPAQAAALHEAGRLYNYSGERAKAHPVLSQAVALRRNLGLPAEADSLVELGETWRTLGRDDRALEVLLRALEIHQKSGNLCGQARANFQLGVVETRATPIPSPGSLARLRRSKEQFAACGDKTGTANALSRLGLNQFETGSFRAGLDSLNQAQSIYEESGDTSSLARLHYDRGLLLGRHLRTGSSTNRTLDTTVARQSLWTSVQLSAQTGNAEAELRALLQLGRLERDQGNTMEAIRLLQSAVEGIEAYRNRIESPEIRMSFFSIKQDYYLHYIAALLDQHGKDPAGGFDLRALEASESRRTRVLAESRDPEMAEASIDVNAIPAMLDGDTLLVEFSHVGSLQQDYDSSPYRMWVISASGIRTFRLATQKVISGAAREFEQARAGLSRAGGEKRFAAAAAALGRLLLTPIAPIRAKRVVFVPDKPFHLLPFSAIPDPTTGIPIGLTKEVVTLPSARLLLAMREHRAAGDRASKEIAIFGDPVFHRNDPRMPGNRASQAATDDSRGRSFSLGRLPFSRREALDIASLVTPSKRMLALGFDATRESTLGSQLEMYRILHFATHGIVDTQDPGKTGLALSMVTPSGDDTDGLLRVGEISKLRLRADLVVLSACQSGVGMDMRGEGVLGLGYAFLFAGAKAVVSSLWKVDDQASAEFMRHFYRGLLGPNRLPVPQAFHRAQREMAAHPRWRSPRHWAAFILHGDWR